MADLRTANESFRRPLGGASAARQWGASQPLVVVRLTPEGPDYDTPPGPGDEVGYGMTRPDDCMRAAIATATQVRRGQVPDLKLDRRLQGGEDPDEISRSSWERIGRWADRRGLTLTFHREVPVPRSRWIGITEGRYGATAFFSDHCLVMSYERLVFDPAFCVRPPAGLRLAAWHPNEITYGISFDKED